MASPTILQPPFECLGSFYQEWFCIQAACWTLYNTSVLGIDKTVVFMLNKQPSYSMYYFMELHPLPVKTYPTGEATTMTFAALCLIYTRTSIQNVKILCSV
jgi:hypothetical protein